LVVAIETDPQGGVYAATPKGLYVSLDNGDKFVRLHSENADLNRAKFISLHFVANFRVRGELSESRQSGVLALISEGVGFTTDQGVSWSWYPIPLFAPLYSVTLDPSGQLLLSTEKGGFRGTWPPLQLNQIVTNQFGPVRNFYVGNGDDLVCLVGKKTFQFLLSRDGGFKWMPLPMIPVGPTSQAIVGSGSALITGPKGLSTLDFGSLQTAPWKKEFEKEVAVLFQLNQEKILAGTAGQGVWKTNVSKKPPKK